MNIQLNNFSFSGDYSVTGLIHDSGTPQELNIMKISRQDGAKLVSSNFAPKEITISGLIKGDTVTELETNIDTFKKSMMVTSGNLDMDYAGSYRRYKVDCSACTISREYYHVTFAPFEIKFVCSDPPFAKDISAVGGLDVLNDVYSSENITSESVKDSFTVEGSAIPKGKIRYKFDQIGDISSIDFINSSTSKQINVSTAFTSGDELLIDHDNLNVTLNGEPVEFEGVFPDLKLGSNSFESNLYLSSGTTLDASQTVNNSFKPLYGSIKLAQSFQVSTSALIPKIQLLLKRVGTISSDILLRIETNSGNAPSGTAVTNGTATILSSNISTNPFWVNISLTDCELSTATTYWLILSTTNGSSENYYEWKANNIGGYTSGTGARYFNAWNTLSWDFCFKVYKNIVDVNNAVETAESFNETFNATTYKDAGNTTADWNTTSGKLLLNKYFAETINQQQLIATSYATLNPYVLLEQTFQVSLSGYITKIMIKANSVGDPGWSNPVLLIVELGGSVSLSDPDGNGYCTATFTSPGKLVVADTTYTMRLYHSSSVGYGRWYGDASNSYPNGSANTGVADFAFKIYLDGAYDTTNNTGQSLALDSASSVIASATVTATQTIPVATSITDALSSDGTNFETITLGQEKYFTNLGSSLKFKETLNGTVSATPSTDALSINYKLASIISDTTHRIAQSFISGFTGNLGRVKLNIKRFGNPGSLTVSIFSDSGGAPNVSLASQVVTETILNDQFGWVSINFLSPASLTSTTTYWIVVSAASVDSSNGYLIRSRSGNTYANGTMSYSTDSGSNYSDYSGEDLLFQTYASSGLQHQFDMKIQYGKRYL